MRGSARSYKASTLLREYILKDIGYITSFRVKKRNGTSSTHNDFNPTDPDYQRVEGTAEELVSLLQNASE